MNESCPICHRDLIRANIRTNTMLVDHSYTVWTCQVCDYVIDFTVPEMSIRSICIAAAFRNMCLDLKAIHAGRSVDEERFENYRRFINTPEFKQHAELWEKQSVSFWEENKHLLFWLDND